MFGRVSTVDFPFDVFVVRVPDLKVFDEVVFAFSDHFGLEHYFLGVQVHYWFNAGAVQNSRHWIDFMIYYCSMQFERKLDVKGAHHFRDHLYFQLHFFKREESDYLRQVFCSFVLGVILDCELLPALNPPWLVFRIVSWCGGGYFGQLLHFNFARLSLLSSHLKFDFLFERTGHCDNLLIVAAHDWDVAKVKNSLTHFYLWHRKAALHCNPYGFSPSHSHRHKTRDRFGLMTDQHKAHLLLFLSAQNAGILLKSQNIREFLWNFNAIEDF